MGDVTASSEDDHEGAATVEAMETGVSSSVGKEEAEAEVDEEEQNVKAVSEVEANPTSSKKVHPMFGRLSVFVCLVSWVHILVVTVWPCGNLTSICCVCFTDSIERGRGWSGT